MEPKYPGNGQGSLSSGKTGNSKPLVIATPTSTVNPIPPLKHLKDENKFRDNITVSQRQVQQARKVSLDHHGSKQPMIEPTARKESSTNPPNGALFNKTTSGANKTITAASTEDAKRDDLDFFVCLEREEHNRKLHEQEQSKWSFLTKRKTSPVEFGDKHDSYNHSSGYYKGNGGSYYNDKRSRYTDDDKWTAQLEQLRAEKDSARQHKFAGGNVYDLTHDDDICFDDPYGFARNDQVGRGLTDSAYYSSGMTDMYSVGRAQASFLDANYSNPPQKKPEQSKSDDAPSNKVILDIYQYAKKSGQCDSNIPAANPTAAPVTNAFLQNFNIMYQTQLLNTDLCSGKDLDALINSSIDSICVEMLKLNLAEVLAYEEQREGGEGRGRHMATHVPPLSFLDVNSYISFFQPLLIEEFKAALISYILDIHGDEKQEHSVVDSIPSGSHKTSTIREFGSVEVRPEVISQRGTESKLHEVHLRVRRQEDRSVDFIKDELVLITNQRIPDSKPYSP
ncbi:hypothetical protein EON65_25780 [archaeon]|nr:MAG: hypothetical protein EON65_25780 [archaeon]